jgi:hypothetical protein
MQAINAAHTYAARMLQFNTVSNKWSPGNYDYSRWFGTNQPDAVLYIYWIMLRL